MSKLKTSNSPKTVKSRSKTPKGKSLKKSIPSAPDLFSPILGEVDLYLFGEGRHELIYQKLGAHVITHEGVKGVSFAVWAPNAERVSVVGDFNYWDGTRHPMRSLGNSGVWEIFIPKMKAG